MEHKNWTGFVAGDWQNEINVRDFIQKNYHPIKFVKAYDLKNLPDEKIFIAELTPDDEDEE